MGSVLSFNVRVRNHCQISGVCMCLPDIFLFIQRHRRGQYVGRDVPSLSWSDWMLHLHQWAMQGELLANQLVRLPPLYPAPDCSPCLPYSLSLSKEASHVALLLLLLSCFSRVWLCATPEMAAHQAPPSLGFSRHEHWSGLPFPSPMHGSEKWKWSCSVVSDS